MNRITWILLVLTLIATSAASYRADPDTFPLYYFVFGVLGCLLMLFITKGVAKKLLSRKEDYYDRV